MRLEAWDATTNATFDHKLWDELCSLRFVDAANNVLIMGPVGVGKTFPATALGHIAVRRRHTVNFERADRLHRRRRMLRDVWAAHNVTFSALSFKQQRALHDYYRFTTTDTELELREHWKRSHSSSLPNRAGKAYVAIRQALANPPAQPKKPTTKRHNVQVHAVARPEIDVDKLVSGLMEFVMEGSMTLRLTRVAGMRRPSSLVREPQGLGQALSSRTCVRLPCYTGSKVSQAAEVGAN